MLKLRIPDLASRFIYSSFAPRLARLAASGLFCTVICASSCSTPPAAPVVSASVAPPAIPTPRPTPDTNDKAHQTANEMGRVPILMYHSIGAPGAYDRNGLNLASSRFRDQLETLHKNGFYPVNLRDLLDPNFAIPAGKSPVVITFDDARGSQFHCRADGSTDPQCAVGILDEMHRKYKDDWPQRATFFVLPKGRYNPVPFWQEGREREKIQYLVNAGYEVANHSTTHYPMARMNDERLTWESENCRHYIQSLTPGATMDTFALPYGIFPRSQTGREILMRAGNKCLVKAWGDASVSPWDKRFDRRNIDRIVPAPGNMERWIATLGRPRDARLCRYISDGDPRTLSIPPSRKAQVALPRVAGLHLALSQEPFSSGRPKPEHRKTASATNVTHRLRKE